MGVKLIDEVKRTPTPELTAADRLVLFLLAESGRDPTRIAMPGQEEMLRASGMSATALKRSLGKLCDVGLIERIPVGVGRNGKPVYACPGRRAEFRILPSSRGDSGSVGGPRMGSAGGPRTNKNGAHLSQEWGPSEVDSGPTGGPPSVNTSRQGTPVNACAREVAGVRLRVVAEKVKETTGRSATEEHAAMVVRDILAGRSPRNPESYVLTAIEREPNPTRFAETPQPPRYQPQPERTA